MADTFITNDIIAKMALMDFKNNLVLAKTVNRQYEPIFSNQTGRTIRIRKPTRLEVADGAALVTQDIEQRTTELTINIRKQVSVSITSEDLTLNLNDFDENVVNPAMLALANQVDSSIYNEGVTGLYNYIGTAGTAPNTLQTIIDAGSKLDAFGIPTKDRFLIMSPFDGGKLKGGVGNVFNEKFNSEIILDSAMGRLGGFDVYTAQNVKQPIAASTVFGTPLIKGAGQVGTTLTIDGVTSGMTFYAGCLFQIAGVYAVNPISRESTGQLANFVVIETVTATGTEVTLTIGSSIKGLFNGTIITGPYKNVTNSPADNAALTFQSTHTKNFFYHKEAFTLAMINLNSPKDSGAWARNLVDKDANVAIRMVRQYNINSDADTIRFDAFYGVRCFGEYGGTMMGSVPA